MAVRTGFNPNRRLTSGNRTDISGDLNALRKQGNPSSFARCVVVDVIYDIEQYTDEDLDLIASSVTNPELIDVMPNNSIIARVISDQQERTNTQGIILLPFFSSHFMLPVKPGEVVWGLFEDIQNAGLKIGYWISRPTEWRTIEDVNFSHSDRKFDPTFHPDNYRTSERDERTSQAVPPGFQNGGNTPSTFSIGLASTDAEQNPFETIFKNAKANQVATYEPVPIRKKRPGDFLIQGSNNSAIVLGEDQTVGAVRGELDVSGSAGAIDLVAGRGRTLPNSQDVDPEKTSARVIENRRGLLEADRAPYRRNKLNNPEEGNNDFAEDASRLYIAQQARADESFALTELAYPENVLVQPQPEASGVKNRAYVVAKSDNVRIIARHNEEVEGSVLIVKEGDENTIASILITKDGRIQVNGAQIFLGRATDGSEEPTLDSVDAGPEPYLRYTKVKEAGESITDTIDNLRQDMRKEIEAVRDQVANLLQQVGVALQSSTCTPYGPDSGAMAAASIINSSLTNVRTANNTQKPTTDQHVSDGNTKTKNKIDEARSKRIFGE